MFYMFPYSSISVEVRGSVRIRMRHALVTDNFLLKISATPPQRRRASGFQFSTHALPERAPPLHKCENRLSAVANLCGGGGELVTSCG